MTVSYDATLDDLVEPGFRLYWKSKSAKPYLYKSVLVTGLSFAVILYFLLRHREVAYLFPSIVVGATLMAAWQYWRFKPRMRRRMKKFVAAETKGRSSFPTAFFIEDGTLRCDTDGVTSIRPLSELQSVSEDQGYLEMYFGDKGLCSIPLRAFSSEAQKAEFVSALKSS